MLLLLVSVRLFDKARSFCGVLCVRVLASLRRSTCSQLHACGFPMRHKTRCRALQGVGTLAVVTQVRCVLCAVAIDIPGGCARSRQCMRVETALRNHHARKHAF